MASFDLICESFKSAWAADAGRIALVDPARIYFDRAQIADELNGFPYLELNVTQDSYEPRTVMASNNALVGYVLEVHAYTCQWQTGGATTGDQVSDQGAIMRALDATLNFITPNAPWESLTGFLHCINSASMTVSKDTQLYQGKDVYHSVSSWNLLVEE